VLRLIRRYLQAGILRHGVSSERHEGTPQGGPQGLRGCYARLALKVNESKTAVAAVWGRKFLGYCFCAAPQGVVKLAVTTQAMHKLRVRIRQLTRRVRGRSLEQIAED